MTLFFLGLTIGWFASFTYHYSQDEVDETAKGAWAVGILLIVILIVVGVNASIISGAIGNTPTPTPAYGGR